MTKNPPLAPGYHWINKRIVRDEYPSTVLTRLTPFMERVRIALDVTPEKLCEICGEDVMVLLKRGKLKELKEDDDMYERLIKHVNKSIGQQLALRIELHRKLQEDRKTRLARREAIRSGT